MVQAAVMGDQPAKVRQGSLAVVKLQLPLLFLSAVLQEKA